jgi:DNA-binding winged helix-turn-helix (wHTH) protein
VDDYVCEPFFGSEIAVRLGLSIRLRQAASSRSAPNSVNVLRSGDLELDLVRRIAARSGKAIDLRPREFLLLEYLVRNVNRPVTSTMILEHLWNSSFDGLTNLVDVYISALRSKIDRDFPHKLIQTNRGIGYTFTDVSYSVRRSPVPVDHSGITETDRINGVIRRTTIRKRKLVAVHIYRGRHAASTGIYSSWGNAGVYRSRRKKIARHIAPASKGVHPPGRYKKRGRPS